MLLSTIGFIIVLIVLARLLWLIVTYLIAAFYNVEEHLAGRQLIQRIDDADINATMVDGIAAFAPGYNHLIAGAAASGLAILSVPFFHWLYAVWVRFLMLFSDTAANGYSVYLKSINTIQDYLPRIFINAIALAITGAFYAAMRRRFQQKNAIVNFVFFRMSKTELFGMALGWLIYMVSAMLPRFTNGGIYNFAGMLTLSGGWMWVLSGILIGMYLRASQNAILWATYRYRWQAAIPAIVRMMAMRRLDLPAAIVKEVEADESTGSATIHANVDAIDADRLRDSLLAVPGLRHPKVIALGPLPGAPVRIATAFAPRMKPLPPRAFRRAEGPPKGYGAEADLLDAAPSTANAANASGSVQNGEFTLPAQRN